jgi:hypothetical protein
MRWRNGDQLNYLSRFYNMDGSHLSILYIPVHRKCAYQIQSLDSLKLLADLIDWIYGHGPIPLPELASWPSSLPTNAPCLDKLAAPSTWDDRPTHPRFRINISFLLTLPMLLTRIKPHQPLGQSPVIPRTPLLPKPAIRVPTLLSGFVNPDRPRVAPLSFHASKPTSTSISIFRHDLGTQFNYRVLSR